jgi:hypothetical protein
MTARRLNGNAIPKAGEQTVAENRTSGVGWNVHGRGLGIRINVAASGRGGRSRRWGEGTWTEMSAEQRQSMRSYSTLHGHPSNERTYCCVVQRHRENTVLNVESLSGRGIRLCERKNMFINGENTIRDTSTIRVPMQATVAWSGTWLVKEILKLSSDDTDGHSW